MNDLFTAIKADCPPDRHDLNTAEGRTAWDAELRERIMNVEGEALRAHLGEMVKQWRWSVLLEYRADQHSPHFLNAALDRMLREARIEGMRKAADVAENWFRRIGHGNPQDEIRALIEEEQTND
jgi:hypothetical protein